MRRIVAGLALALLATNAWAMCVLDDFDSGPLINYVTSPGSTGDPVACGCNTCSTTWGGMRSWELCVIAASPAGTAQVVVVPAGSVAALYTGASVSGHLHLSYGSYAGAGDQDEDWRGLSGLSVYATFVDGTGLLTADLTSGGVTYTSASTPVVMKGAGWYEIPFSSFPGVNLGDVDGVRYTFTTLTPGFDVEIGNVGLTPEPTTAAFLGLGMLILARRRRRN